nr:hypothetical protein [Tanacetum cinerariifolium]
MVPKFKWIKRRCHNHNLVLEALDNKQIREDFIMSSTEIMYKLEPREPLINSTPSAYENSLIYKERTKKLHDDKIKTHIFNVSDQVLLFNSRLKIFSDKLKSRWSDLFTISEIYPYGTAKLIHPDGCKFKVNCHRLKHYHGRDPPPLKIPDITLSLRTTEYRDRDYPRWLKLSCVGYMFGFQDIRLPIGGISLYDLPERREDDEFVQLWLSQFAPKKKKRIFATDIAEKLVRSTRVDFRFKVNFLMLFANVKGKADTMRAFVNLSVVRRIREDTNIVGVDWCDFIHRCLAISHEPNIVSGFYNGPLPAIKNWSTKNMSTRQYLEIEDEAFGKFEFYGEWSENETVEVEGFCEYASVLPHTDKKYKGFFKETVLLEEAKAQKAPQNVKPKPAAVKTKEAVEKPNPAENVKRLAEKPKEPTEKAHKAPKNVKPKPAAVKTNEVSEKPMPDKNVKELAEKPKEPAGDDYQVVPAATVMKAEDREEFKVETFTQWIEGNIDWVREEYVKPVKPVNSPYMCRRIDVIARCKRIEFVLGNSLFAMEGDKYETFFQSFSGYRELSSVRVNMETLAPTLWIDANVIDCWAALLNFKELALGYPTPTRHLFPTGCIIKGTLTKEEQLKSFYDEIKAQFKYEPSSMSLSDFELVLFLIYASDHFYVVVFNIKKPKTMVIQDNSDSGYTYASKYKEACDSLRMRYKIATKIMLHQFNVVSNKMFDFAFMFNTKYTEQARVSMIVDAIKNMNNHDPPKQVKETDAANVVVGVNEVVDQVKKKRRQKK